jgi:hypothetical protein
MPRSSFTYRLASCIPYNEIKTNYHKLTKKKEEVIVRYILDLDLRGFALQFTSIKDIANYILESRGGEIYQEELGLMICIISTRSKNVF